MSDLHWTSALTEIKPNEVRLRGYKVVDLMGDLSFGATFYLLIKGDLPTPAVGKLMDAMLISSLDHGTSPPSALTARTIASTGAALNASVAGGILAINRFHGGAIEDCMTALQRAKSLLDEGLKIADAATQVIKEYKEKGRRIAGFGHRIHTEDPRSEKLFNLARAAGLQGDFLNLANEIVAVLAQKGKKLPLNVDGAIAAVLCELDFDNEIANGFFLLARAGGLIAHWQEESSREKPMRRIHPTDWDYDGPGPREL